MRPQTALHAALVLLCLLISAANTASAQGDFEAGLVQEAVDLSAASSHSADAEDSRDMESLLHWAIEHSDSEALHQQAEQVRRDEAIRDFQERKQRVKELSDIVSQQPTETQLMQEHIATLNDPQASTSDKEAALAQLQVLVEPIDNANDLKVLDGLQPLVSLLEAADTPAALQAGAAHVLGTAVSNNEKLAGVVVQQHPEVLQRLLKLAGTQQDELVGPKAMYALARLVAGPAPSARTAFYNSGGMPQLQALLGASAGVSTRVKTKAVNLVSDLIELTASGDDSSLETWNESAMAAFGGAALDLLQQSEALDVKEKALFAMRTLLLRRGPAGGAALANEGAEAVLREALTELDLLTQQYQDKAAAAKAAAEAAAQQAAGKDAAAAPKAGKGSSKGAGSSKEADAAADGTAGAAAEAEEEGKGERDPAVEQQEAEEHEQYAAYIAHLCADVLHHLAVHHDEL